MLLEKYNKVIFLQRLIKEYLYKPDGKMYIKTMNHFNSITY